MQKSVFDFDVKQIGNEKANFTLEGHVAAFGNVDHDLDVLEKGAFLPWMEESKSKGKKSVPIFWAHQSREPIGVMPLEYMQEDQKGLFIKGLLPKEDQFVTGRVMPQLRIGSVGKMSMGFTVKDFEYHGNIRHLKSVNLWEGSLVAIPANENAVITEFKSVTPFGDLPLADRQRVWDSNAAIGRVRQWVGINEPEDLVDPDAQKKYRQAFFWYDGADPDLLGGYKLPFADIINGRLTAVPRAIFAAAGALQGARGGVYIFEHDRPGVVRNVERYYEKMNLESPFGKSFRIDDLASIDERTLEKIFKTGACFGHKLSCAVISAIKSAGLRDVVEPSKRDVVDDSILMAKMNEILNNIREVNHERHSGTH